jgi:hypothetical protein
MLTPIRRPSLADDRVTGPADAKFTFSFTERIIPTSLVCRPFFD